MSSCEVRPVWFRRMTWSTFVASNSRSFLRIVSGEPISPTLSVSCALGVWRHSWYSSHILPWPGDAMPWRP